MQGGEREGERGPAKRLLQVMGAKLSCKSLPLRSAPLKSHIKSLHAVMLLQQLLSAKMRLNTMPSPPSVSKAQTQAAGFGRAPNV